MHETHPFFVRPMSRRQLIALDLAAALGFAFVFFTATAGATGLSPWVKVAVPLGLGLPLAVRRIWPLPVFCLTLAVAVVAALAGAVSFAYASPAYAVYLVAMSDRVGALVPTSAIGTVSVVTVFGLVVAGGAPAPGLPAWMLHIDQPLLGIAAIGGTWTVGRAVRERRLYAARDAERLASQAVAEERLRIARELHDIVTHSVGLIAVKAGVANHVMASRPEEAHDALRVIEAASRGALVEMRHLLGVLRSTDGPDLVPAPGLRGLERLAEQARLAGVEVDLDVWIGGPKDDVADGRPTDLGENRDPATMSGERRLPEGVELTVYRIVQEALTNVVKHAAPARCRVSVTADGRDVRIEVADDGPGRRALPGESTGHGLIGMRERVMMYGGTFDAGPLPGRGFRVVARFSYGGVP